MSAQPQPVNRPDFEQEQWIGMVGDDPSRREPRHVFSPFLDIPTFFENFGFKWIRQGIIRSVKDHTYSVPDHDAIQKAFNKRNLESPHLGRIPWTATAADVTEALLRTNGTRGDEVPTGLVTLHHLQNVDPGRPDHAEFLRLINEMLWPVNHETSEEHKQVLRQVDLSPFMKFPADLFQYAGQHSERTPLWRAERTVTQLLDEAIPRSEAYCRAEYRELADDLKMIASGGPQSLGSRKEADGATRKACRWLALPEPVRPMTALDAIYNLGVAPGAGHSNDAALSMIAQQVQQQGQVLEILAGKLVSGEPGTVDVLASFGDIMRSQQALLEKLAMKEQIVVAGETREDEVTPKNAKVSGSKPGKGR